MAIHRNGSGSFTCRTTEKANSRRNNPSARRHNGPSSLTTMAQPHDEDATGGGIVIRLAAAARVEERRAIDVRVEQVARTDDDLEGTKRTRQLRVDARPGRNSRRVRVVDEH